MKLRLLRNATLKLEIRGRIVLIDPFLAPKGSRPSFTGRAPNPLVELPASPEEILDGIELVIVTVSRDELRRHATEQGVSPQQLLIPLDGETMQLKSRQA